jgi:hypothetical protein
MESIKGTNENNKENSKKLMADMLVDVRKAHFHFGNAPVNYVSEAS